MSLTPSIAAGRTFWHDKIRVGYGFGFTKNFHRYTSPQLDPRVERPGGDHGRQPRRTAPYGAGLSNFYLDPSRDGTIGGYNISYSLSHTISGGVQLSDKWSIDVLYVIIDSFTYDHTCATSNVAVAGQQYDTCSAGDRVAANSGASLARPSHRDSQVFWATLGYQPLDWLGHLARLDQLGAAAEARLELPAGHHLDGLRRVHDDPAGGDDHRRQAGGPYWRKQ